MGRGCVKTPREIFRKKIDRIEQPTSYDRYLGNGFGTPNFFANLLEFEFLHRLGTMPNVKIGSKLALKGQPYSQHSES